MADKRNIIHKYRAATKGGGVTVMVDAYDFRGDRVWATDMIDVTEVDEATLYNKALQEAGVARTGGVSYISNGRFLQNVKVLGMENNKAMEIRTYAALPGRMQDRLKIHSSAVIERLPYINNGSSVTFLPRGTWVSDRKGIVNIQMRGPTIIGDINSASISTIFGTGTTGWSAVPLGYVNDGPYKFDAPYGVTFPTWCLRFNGYTAVTRSAPFTNQAGVPSAGGEVLETTLWHNFSGADKPWYIYEQGLGVGPPSLIVFATTFPAHIP